MRQNDATAAANNDAFKYCDGGASAAGMYAALDGATLDDSKPPELATMFLELVRKIVAPGRAKTTALRFVSLVLHLMPDSLDLSQLQAAKQLGCTRAGLSKTGIVLAERLGLGHARWRKMEGSRNKYSEAQLRAHRRGTHVSQILKKRKLALAAIDTVARANETKRIRAAHPNKPRKATARPS